MKKYIDRFLGRKAVMDILPFFETSTHGSAGKEITESSAMLSAAENILGISNKDENVVCIVVGDGSKPRTGGLVSHLTKWQVISVDPQFNLDWYEKYSQHRIEMGTEIQRLYLIKDKIENCNFNLTTSGKRVVMLLPHSHADLRNCIKSVKSCARLDLISMPCCVKTNDKWLLKDYVIKHKMIHYKDENVWSPKNDVYTWQELNYGR